MDEIWKDKLCLGTAALGMKYGFFNKNYFDKKQSLEILHFSFDLGIKNLELSEGYGDIISILNLNTKIEFNLTLKIIAAQQNLKELLEKFKFLSKKFKNNKIMNILIHDWDNLNFNEQKQVVKFLEVVSKERIKIGISTYNIAFPRILENSFGNRYIAQYPSNPIDKRIVNLIKKTKIENKPKIWIRSIFLQGLIVNPKANTTMSKHKCIQKYFQKLNKMKINPLNFALSDSLNNNDFDQVLIGPTNEKELIEIYFNLINLPKYQIGIDHCHHLNIIDIRKWKNEIF